MYVVHIALSTQSVEAELLARAMVSQSCVSRFEPS